MPTGRLPPLPLAATALWLLLLPLRLLRLLLPRPLPLHLLPSPLLPPRAPWPLTPFSGTTTKPLAPTRGATGPAQFAAIRTDAELNEIGEPLMLYCQPANDYLPDPQSCLITGITPQLCLEKGVPEHEFAQPHRGRVCPARHHWRGLQHHPV
jgi:hypothetical protein